MNRQLFAQAVGKFVMGLVFAGLLLFLPAGTLRYWNGWLLITLLFVPMCVVGGLLMLRAPELLKKRLNTKEGEKEQKVVILFSALMFLSVFILAGLNHRYQWHVMSKWAVWSAGALFVLSFLAYAEVLRENPFLSRTVEIQEDQRVIDTGLYGVVRHPMYTATIFLFLSMPLVLGCVLSFVISLLYLPILGKRIKNEEEVLEKGLEGYTDYKNRVKYKVIPFLW